MRAFYIRFSLFFLTIGLLTSCHEESNAQCVGPLADGSMIDANPDDINGEFEFNYLVKSNIKYDSGDDSGELLGDYYLNTTDGSILFHKGFFLANFETIYSGDIELDAAIMMPSGKIVIYIYDRENDQKRAVQLASDQTANDKAIGQFYFLQQFFNESVELRETPAPKPTGLRWRTQPYAASIEQPDGSSAKITIHLAENSGKGPIKTSSPAVGMLVGIVKDFAYRKCNRLAVYTKMEAEDGTIEAELKDIVKMSKYFDGVAYKKTTLGFDLGGVGKLSEEESDALMDDMDRFQSEMNELMRQFGRCGDDRNCQARIEKQMAALQKRMQDRAYDLVDPELTGIEGTSFAMRKKAIEDQMYALQTQMIDQKLRCDKLSERLGGCRSGCGALENRLELCREEYERMEEEMKVLECDMARLMGVEGLADDCE